MLHQMQRRPRRYPAPPPAQPQRWRTSHGRERLSWVIPCITSRPCNSVYEKKLQPLVRSNSRDDGVIPPHTEERRGEFAQRSASDRSTRQGLGYTRIRRCDYPKLTRFVKRIPTCLEHVCCIDLG